MTKVLIADSSKPSLVMSSEVFKDKIPGAVVLVATTGRDMLELVAVESPDICLVDFDLPDVDGATLIVALRKIYSGPILMTAFPTAIVGEAVSALLFHYNDASAWIPKPVRFEVLSEKIDSFLIYKRRLGRRFDMGLESTLIAKASGRGKRAPKTTARLTNLSLGGACVKLDAPMKFPKAQEITLSIMIPADGKTTVVPRIVAASKAAAKTKAAKKAPPKRGASAAKPAKIKVTEQKFRAQVAWVANEGEVGLRFTKLSVSQRRDLENYLRSAAQQPLVVADASSAA